MNDVYLVEYVLMYVLKMFSLDVLRKKYQDLLIRGNVGTVLPV